MWCGHASVGDATEDAGHTVGKNRHGTGSSLLPSPLYCSIKWSDSRSRLSGGHVMSFITPLALGTVGACSSSGFGS